jgi:hypothetical protein
VHHWGVKYYFGGPKKGEMGWRKKEKWGQAKKLKLNGMISKAAMRLAQYSRFSGRKEQLSSVAIMRSKNHDESAL